MKVIDYHRTIAGLMLVGLISTAPITAAEQKSPEDAIQAAYQKACTAAALKYMDGIFSVRTANFVAFTMDGHKVNLQKDRAAIEKIILNALNVKQSSNIQEFKLLDSRHAQCRTRDYLEVRTVDTVEKHVVDFSVETVSKDEWILTKRGWRQTSSRVLEQIFHTRPGTTDAPPPSGSPKAKDKP